MRDRRGPRPTTAPVSKVEGIKVTSDYLRGTIAEELAGDAPVFSSDSYELLKFHGIYEQDDRDVRGERKREGPDVDHICMVRVSIPGGTLNAEQYLYMDKLCSPGRAGQTAGGSPGGWSAPATIGVEPGVCDDLQVEGQVVSDLPGSEDVAVPQEPFERLQVAKVVVIEVVAPGPPVAHSRD